jgi:biotin operon repressor
MTLEEVKFNYIYGKLLENNGDRSKTAEELGISRRGITDYIKKMKLEGYFIPDKRRSLELDPEEDQLFPTNQQRLRHADYMINKVYF